MFDTGLEIASFVFNWIATIITIACYLPQTIKTMICKQTSDLSKWFFIFSFGCSVAWIIGAFISLFNYIEQSLPIGEILLLTLPVIVSNVIGLIASMIVLVIKLNNMSKAHKQNITEKQYCELIKYKKSKVIEKL